MIGFKQYCFEGSKKVLSNDEVDKKLKDITHVATRSEYQEIKDNALYLLRRFPTHHKQIFERYKTLSDSDPNFFAINDDLYDPFERIEQLKANPVLLKNMPFDTWEGRDWITRDRKNIKYYKWSLMWMEPEEVKKILDKNWGINHDPRYKKFAQEELNQRRIAGLLNHEIIM